jgi:hypothetical protein
MIGNLPISGSDLGEIASKGSPTLLRIAGRAFGLGEEEQSALINGKFPIWFWIVLGAAGGVYAGVQLQKRYPRQIANILEAK